MENGDDFGNNLRDAAATVTQSAWTGWWQGVVFFSVVELSEVKAPWLAIARAVVPIEVAANAFLEVVAGRCPRHSLPSPPRVAGTVVVVVVSTLPPSREPAPSV